MRCLSQREGEEKQGEFWSESARGKPKSQGLYSKLNEHLAALDFTRLVWALCAPSYCEDSQGGRRGIYCVVYVKIRMVGILRTCEASERSRRLALT